MSALRDPLKPIPAHAAQAFSAWQIPQLCAAETSDITASEPPPQEAPVALIDEQALQALRDKAYQEGFAQGEQDGLALGEQKAAELAQQQLNKRLSSLQTLMQALFEPIAEQDQQIESALLDLLQQLAKAVIRRELQTDSSQILPLLRKALSLLPMGADKLHLWVSRQDFETIKTFRDHHNEHWRICEDPNLLPGGFRLESENSRIDASIESRLEQALAQLAEQQREQRLHPPEADLQIDICAPPALSPNPSPINGRGESDLSPFAGKGSERHDAAFSPRPPAGEEQQLPSPACGRGAGGEGNAA